MTTQQGPGYHPDMDIETPPPSNDENKKSVHVPWKHIGGYTLTFLLAFAIGASGGDEAPTAAPVPEPEVVVETETVEVEVESQEALDRIAELEAELAEAQEQPAEEAEPEPEVSGDYTAGKYVFNDVQVSRDGLGDFEVRARVTNTGGSTEGVVWTATVFNDGSVVSTLSGSASSLGSGETVTVTFVSVDSYGDWDDVEFQVDMDY